MKKRIEIIAGKKNNFIFNDEELILFYTLNFDHIFFVTFILNFYFNEERNYIEKNYEYFCHDIVENILIDCYELGNIHNFPNFNGDYFYKILTEEKQKIILACNKVYNYLKVLINPFLNEFYLPNNQKRFDYIELVEKNSFYILEVSFN